MKRVIYLVTLSLFAWTSKVQAQASKIIPNPISGLPGGQSIQFEDQLTNFIEIFLGVVGLIAVVFIIIGGFRYITSGGDAEAAESAKKTITNAIIGLVVIILSYIIVTVIVNAIYGNA